MEEKLQIVFREYIREVEGVCNLLIKSINDSENTNLRNKYDFLNIDRSVKKWSLKLERLNIDFMVRGVQFLIKKML